MSAHERVVFALDRGFSEREREFCLAADCYARMHWPVFALSDKKRPLFGSHGHLDARITRSWPSMRPIGIATGAANLVVLDVDPRHGGDDWLRVLLREHGELPETPRANTPSGGMHFYFEGETQSRNGLRPGLDIKSRGGYVVAPPTIGYRWIDGAHPNDVPLAPVPAWLETMLTPAPRRPAALPREYVTTAYAKAALTRGWREIAGAPDGARNSTLNRVVFGWARYLRQIPDEQLIEIALDAARAAGLSEREAFKTIASSAIKAGRSK